MGELTGWVYGLRDPRDSAYRYVGQTLNLSCRRRQHQDNAWQGNPEKTRWIYDLESAGLKPEMVILEEVVGAENVFCNLLDREVHWCRKLTNEGHPLLNRPVGKIIKTDLVSEKQVTLQADVVRKIREDFMAARNDIAKLIGTKRLGKQIDKIDWVMLALIHRLDDIAWEIKTRQSNELHEAHAAQGGGNG